MQSDSVVIDPRALSVTAVGQEFPVAYRLVRRGGELVLQVMIVRTYGRWIPSVDPTAGEKAAALCIAESKLADKR